MCYGGTLSTDVLLDAYYHGIFPLYNKDDPIIWWSPNPRFILEMKDFRVGKTLKKIIKNNNFEIRFNTLFEQVIRNCKKTHSTNHGDTWILEETIQAYVKLHEMNYAKSVEVYQDGNLVGGLYGVEIANVFCGESMFSLVNNAGKVGFYYLFQELKKRNFDFIDCQIYSNLFESFGAKNIPRDEFLNKLQKSILIDESL